MTRRSLLDDVHVARALLMTIAVAVTFGGCGQILGVDSLRGPPDGASDAGAGDAADAGLGDAGDTALGDAGDTALGDAGDAGPDTIAPSDASADAPLPVADAIAPDDGTADTGSDSSGPPPDAAPDASVYAFLPIGAGILCAQSIASGDDSAAVPPVVNGAASNGTWFVGCDNWNYDSNIYELADGYKSGVTPNAGPTQGRDLAIGAGPNGHAWLVDREGDVFEWTSTAFTARPISGGVGATPSEEFVGTWQSTIAVDPGNNAWIISTVPAKSGNFSVYYYNSSAGTWNARNDIYGVQIAVAPDPGTVIWTLVRTGPGTASPTAWDLSQTPASPHSYDQCATNIAVGPKNTPWILDCTVGESASNGSVGVRVSLGTSSGVFTPIVDITGHYFYAASLGVSTAAGAPWYVDSNGNVFSGTLISGP
jgi:hypothetical protein